MITFISFILIMTGVANWLCIGLMQYDFIAGFFGTQSSFLSRLIYIIIGFAGVWFLIMAIKQKGRIKINSNGFEKDVLGMEKPSKKREEKKARYNQTENQDVEYKPGSIEAGSEIHERNSSDRRSPFE